MSLYKKHREQVKNDIIQLALSLFREYGYENVTIEQITGKLEIAKGTFYNFFQSKRDILMTWAEELFSSVDIGSALQTDQKCLDNLSMLLEYFTQAISRESSLFRNFLVELDHAQANKTEAQRSFDFGRLLLAAINSSVDGVDFTRKNSELKLQVLNSAVFYELKLWILSGKEIGGLADHLIEVLEICLNGMLEKEEL